MLRFLRFSLRTHTIFACVEFIPTSRKGVEYCRVWSIAGCGVLQGVEYGRTRHTTRSRVPRQIVRSPLLVIQRSQFYALDRSFSYLLVGGDWGTILWTAFDLHGGHVRHGCFWIGHVKIHTDGIALSVRHFK